MNYFAHYFLYEKSGDEYFNLGLILPDFARSALGKRRLYLEDLVDEGQEIVSLKQGCYWHYYADDWFHRSAFFIQIQSEISALLQGEPELYLDQRPWFISHIFAELLLDRIIIRKDEEALNRFYSDLIRADISLVKTFLTACGKTEFSVFEKFYDTFCEVKYLYYYKDDERLIYSLNRIIRSTNQPELSEDAKRHLILAIPKLESRIYSIEKPREMARLSVLLRR